MTGSTTNSVLDRGTRRRGARAVAGSRLHNHYAALLAEPLPADFRDLVAQLVALGVGRGKSNERLSQVLPLAPPLPGQRS
jgi:hypothetical protein